MSTRFLTLLPLVLCLCAPAWAQETPPDTQKPETKGTADAGSTQPEKRPAPELEGQPVNIRLDLTISDYPGAGEPTKRAVTVIVADRHVGFVRTSGTHTTPGRSTGVHLNVDARPQILSSGKVRVGITLQYAPAPAEPAVAMSALNQQFTLVLEPGKSFLMSEASDPLSNRKMTVEGRVTILK